MRSKARQQGNESANVLHRVRSASSVGRAQVDLAFREARTPGRDERVDVSVAGGRIVEVGPRLACAARREVPLAGKLLVPGFVDIHMHLDKAFTGDFRENVSGTLDEARHIFLAYKQQATAEDIARRARRLVRMALRHGTTAIRTHADIDESWGTRSVEALVALREEFRGVVDIQVVAFPAPFIHTMPEEGLPLIRRGLELGADLVGGITLLSKDPLGHCWQFIGLAKAFDRDVDMHVDECGDPGTLAIRDLARATRELGYEGRVTAGHLCSLDTVDRRVALEAIAEVAAAGITAVSLPSCNMYLQGRSPEPRTWRGIAPVRMLRNGGVNVCYASDNVRDGFNPFGNADMLEGGLILAHAAHMGNPADLCAVLEMGTVNPGRTFYRGRLHGLAPGAPADLVVLDATDPGRAIIEQPECVQVYKAGRLVASNSVRSSLHGDDGA